MGGYGEDHEIPIIARGEGCYVWDDHGKKYLDALSALFCVNIGHGRHDVAQAGADQARELGFFTNWSYAHPPAIELAARIASLAPGDLNRVFFTSGGSEAVEAALKLARQYHKLTGAPEQDEGHRARDRLPRRHARRAQRDRHHADARRRSSRSPPAAATCPTRTSTACAPGYGVENLAESIAQRIEFEGPETVSAVILEPVQNAGGCFTPPEGYFQRVREICDQYDVLLISDEVICSWGRLGYYFGAERYGYQPDIITTAKGITSAYAPMGAVIASDAVFEPFAEGKTSFLHGITFGGHPMAAAVAMANLDVFEHEGILENVREHEGDLRDMLESLRDIEIVGDVRGAGYFHAHRAGPRPRHQAPLHRRAERDADPRLPLRGDVPPRADLPRRRPRRPGHPVLAAAHRRPRAVRGDRGGPAPGPRGGIAEDVARVTADADHPRGPGRRRRRPAGGRGQPRHAGPLGAHLRAAPTRRRGCRAASCC